MFCCKIHLFWADAPSGLLRCKRRVICPCGSSIQINVTFNLRLLLGRAQQRYRSLSGLHVGMFNTNQSTFGRHSSHCLRKYAALNFRFVFFATSFKQNCRSFRLRGSYSQLQLCSALDFIQRSTMPSSKFSWHSQRQSPQSQLRPQWVALAQD